MKNSKLLVSFVIIITLSLGAVGGIMLWNRTSEPASSSTLMYPPNDPTDSPVDLKNGTRILWNGEDITHELSGEIATIAGKFALYEAFVDTTDEMGIKSPADGFELLHFGADPQNPHTPILAGDDVGFFWSSPAPHVTMVGGIKTAELGNQHYTYALDGKTVAEISFSGIDKKYLKAVGDKGIVLNFDAPGKYELFYGIRDSEGCDNATTAFEFSVS